MSRHHAKMMPKKDTTEEMRESFEAIWRARRLEGTDLKSVCYDFFLYGAHEAAWKLKRGKGEGAEVR